LNGRIWNQDIKAEHLISVLSKMDNYRVFIAAKEGIKYSPQVVEKMGLSRKRYYNALSLLNRHDLIRRDSSTGRSVHTVFGEMIYRCILEMNKHAEHIEHLMMIDTLKQTGEFTSHRIMQFLKMVSEDGQIARNVFGTFAMVWSYKAMITILLEHIHGASSEILVAARLLPEEVIRALRVAATHGVKVQILSDVSLVETYFALQRIPRIDGDSINRKEYIGAAGNPWNQNMPIQHRITNVPFGITIIDAREVAIELINAHNVTEFSGGLIVQDIQNAEVMKGYFEKLWTRSQESSSFYEGRNTKTDTAA
jgi:hypothetical protein